MIYHQNNFSTNLTSNTLAGATTTPLNSIPTVAAQFYIALDATNINSHYEVVKATSKTATNINHSATSYAHTTTEEVRMVLPAEELDSFQSLFNAWLSVTDTWAYASATTITVPAGAASTYQKGDKIRFQNNSSGTYLYAYITGVADTVLTVTGDAVPNATLTDKYYSKQDNPQGFPGQFTLTNGHKFSMNGQVATLRYEASALTLPTGGFETTLAVAFDKAFSANPVVNVQLTNGTSIFGAAGEWTIVNIHTAPSTTGFTFHARTQTGTWAGNRSAQFNWIAVGLI
jgi:hypothetical protein